MRGGHSSFCSEESETYPLKVNLYGSLLELLSAFGQAVGPGTWGWSGTGKRKPVTLARVQCPCSKTCSPFPHPVISFLSSSAKPRRSGCPESPRLSSKKPELANDHFSHPTVAWGPGHILWPVVGCQGGLSTELGRALQPAPLTL